MTILINELALAGYRSFGKNIQHFEQFSKINLFIGQNNCGKSNVLRFISDLYPQLNNLREIKLTPLDIPLPSGEALVVGKSRSLETSANGDYEKFQLDTASLLPVNVRNSQISGCLLDLMKQKAILEGTDNCWFYTNPRINNLPQLNINNDSWVEAAKQIDDRQLTSLWANLTNHSGGGTREGDWLPGIINVLAPKYQKVSTVMIPAIRQVGAGTSEDADFSGLGIIDRLAKLQDPDALSQKDRLKFDQINKFLQSVTGSSEAIINIPYDRNTILVHMDGKSLPLESLGTGIHEVIILAAAATILDKTVVCMEEPELHLHPLLQKKLVRYLASETSNQYFITTHSAALMDTPDAEVYHIKLEDGSSTVERVSSDNTRASICHSLGYTPSDLLQANCVIWVEGPSDRIYLNFWINSQCEDFIEGIHYSIMFYGGRLASHLSGEDSDNLTESLISLRRLNRRSVILIDSDKDGPRKRVNATKLRLQKEFNEGAGFAWVTIGREIENYVTEVELSEAIAAVHPRANHTGQLGQWDNTLKITGRSGNDTQASKVKIAEYIASKFEPNFNILDLQSRIEDLCQFISESSNN